MLRYTYLKKNQGLTRLFRLDNQKRDMRCVYTFNWPIADSVTAQFGVPVIHHKPQHVYQLIKLLLCIIKVRRIFYL